MAARLSFDERCVISAMVGVGASARQIADELGRHSSTVRREINRAGGRGVYRAEDAQTEAEVRTRRPKVPKLVTDPQLAEAVTERLEMGWSPHAVASDLRNEGSLSLVCAETIYQACYEPCGARGLTVGHEITGWVESSGPGRANLEEGTPVAVYGAWGCGACRQCAAQSENYCENAAEVVASGPGRPGLGRDGGIAEFFLAPQSRHLIPLPPDLDPVKAAPLTDAELTTYHAVKQSLGRLHPGATAVVIGIGGLGSLAVQILRALGRPSDRSGHRTRPSGGSAPPRRPSHRLGHRGRFGRHSGAHGRPGCGVDPGYRGNRRHPDTGRLRHSDPRAYHGGGHRAGILPHGLCPRSQRNLGLYRILGNHLRSGRGSGPGRYRRHQKRHREVPHATSPTRLPEASGGKFGRPGGDRPPRSGMSPS